MSSFLSSIRHIRVAENNDRDINRLVPWCLSVVWAKGGGGGGGRWVGSGALPYVAYTGSCRWTGYGLWSLCSEQGIKFQEARESALNRFWICPKQGKVARLSSLNLICPKQGPKIEGDVLLRVGILGLFCPIDRVRFLYLSAAPLYPNIGQVPRSPRMSSERLKMTIELKIPITLRLLCILSAYFCIWYLYCANLPLRTQL